MITVLTTGCYDLLHAGHCRHLRESAAQGDELIVALDNDERVRLHKGEDRPIVPQEERELILLSLRFVNVVELFGNDETLEAIIDLLKPDVLSLGEEYRDTRIIGREIIEGYGGRIHFTKRMPRLSTTERIATCRSS